MNDAAALAVAGKDIYPDYHQLLYRVNIIRNVKRVRK